MRTGLCGLARSEQSAEELSFSIAKAMLIVKSRADKISDVLKNIYLK